jgi:protease IV
VAVRRGVWIVLFLIFLAVVSSAALVALSWMALARGPMLPSSGVLDVRVTGDLDEIPVSMVDQLFQERPTMRSLTEAIRAAKTDSRVTGLLLHPVAAPALWGKVHELRDALIDFKTSGKPLVAFLEFAGDREYILASVADRIVLVPSGQINLLGTASYQVFLRGTFDKIGTTPDLLHVGDYKTAVNTFTETGFTPEHREMTESLNRDAYEQMLALVASARGRTPDEVRAIMDEGPLQPADALRHGLVDDVAYADELGRTSGLGDDFTSIEMRRYLQAFRAPRTPSGAPRVAVLYAVGTIVSGTSGDGPTGVTLGSETFVDYVRRVREDDRIKAVVLRIDSPGGSTVASDVIWRELVLLRDKKPLVVSMSDLAASGGYYIAMPAHAIVAQPGTLTGSIGIFGGKFVVAGTYNKLGMTIETVSDGRFAEMYSGARPFTPDERVKVQEQMQAFYDQFVEKVADARGRAPEEIDRVAQGRVWTGRQARDVGLVDDLGGIERAMAIARERAGIAPDQAVQVVVYPPRKTVFEVLSSSFSSSEGVRQALVGALLSDEERTTLGAVRRPMSLLRRGELLALLPWEFVRP